ncbi:hypothetical protein DFH27DRAFT_578016 [Peziza echinospora]|nr:hypothetical protein DFH27DRAFT_578016 [Peziza echinospora]
MHIRPPRRRHSRPVSSRRYLSLRHGHRVLRALETGIAAHADGSDLAPGHERLHSSKVPGIKAGEYELDATQTIVAREGEQPELAPKTTKQHVTVVAPRFVLPSEAVYSVYPAPGQSARPEVLPHVVLNDATFPWERSGSENAEAKPPEDYEWNRVPWVAVLAFTADELALTPEELATETGIFRNTTLVKNMRPGDNVSQTEAMAVMLPVADVVNLGLDHVAVPTTFNSKAVEDAVDEKNANTSLIFPKSGLFRHLFATYDKHGKIAQEAGVAPDVSRYRLLAHVRHVNTEGMTHADEVDAGEPSDREFAAVVSHRTGPLGLAAPGKVVVHMVSIEGIEAMAPFPVVQARVAMVSLHSWTYMCLPGNSFSAADSFAALGEGTACGPLRPVMPSWKTQEPEEEADVKARVLRRVADGYSLTRYRVKTGETTAAFTRGPLVPTDVRYPLFAGNSASGASLHIMDRQLGVLDISYSAAWQLGKALGMADQAFAAALGRVRKQVGQVAHNRAQVRVLADAGIAFKGKEELIRSIAGTVERLAALPAQRHSPTGGRLDAAAARWRTIPPPVPSLSRHGAEISEILDEELHTAACEIASGSGGATGVAEDGHPPPYNEYNTAASPDWMVVHKFVTDLLHLVNIPPHYLVTDPSHLPQESIRFFHVDQNWLDAAVDGALSLGNHADHGGGVRRALKAAYNRYLAADLPALAYRPAVPRYGFFVRSVLITQFADMRVTTEPARSKLDGPVLLRQEIVDPEIMFCLLTDQPKRAGAEGELLSLMLTQPPHQQYFTAGRALDSKTITLSYKRNYTMEDVQDPHRSDPVELREWKRGHHDDRGAVFIWGGKPEEGAADVRTLHVENLADDLRAVLTAKMNGDSGQAGWFAEQKPTSGLLAYQLNEPSWQLKVQLPPLPRRPSAMQLSCGAARTVMVAAAGRTFAEARGTHAAAAAAMLAGAPFPTYAERNTQFAPLPFGRMPYARTAISASILPRTPEIAPSDDPTGFPKFSYSVAPADNPESMTVEMHPYRQDLIFSINYVSGAMAYMLRKLTVSIPMTVADNANLAGSYDGAGATMLSNLRFVARHAVSDANNSLLVVLLPRSRAKKVAASLIPDMSFLLAGVQVNAEDGPRKVTVSVEIEYNNIPVFKAPPFYIDLVKPLKEPVEPPPE